MARRPLLRVSSGLDRLMQRGPAVAGLASGARIGLLAHAASIDSDAHHAVELLAGAKDFRLTRLFAPEHGLFGHEQDMEQVRESVEPLTGLPVISLYGDTPASLAPLPQDLEGLDAIVCDLQDVGSRYYTFTYTVSYVMEAAAAAGVPVVVLDRPNPIGGESVQGPVLDPALASFVGRYPLPVRHGMTIGELSLGFNQAFSIGCDLRVVPLENWTRAMMFEHTGLPWVPPSPNMPTPGTALVYPGGCLVEGTNLSEGRGTTTPFELCGAPWLDQNALAAAMRREAPDGVRFRAASFRPMFQKHGGKACRGVQVIPTDPERFDPFGTFLVLLREARKQRPADFHWRSETYEFESTVPAIDLLLGRSDLRPLIESDRPLSEMEALWRDELSAFIDLRKRFLMYPAT